MLSAAKSRKKRLDPSFFFAFKPRRSEQVTRIEPGIRRLYPIILGVDGHMNRQFIESGIVHGRPSRQIARQRKGSTVDFVFRCRPSAYASATYQWTHRSDEIPAQDSVDLPAELPEGPVKSMATQEALVEEIEKRLYEAGCLFAKRPR
jgi:hypothetical protein